MNFCITPAGAWGTAMAIHLCRAGHIVTLAPLTLEEALDMARQRENKMYLPGYPLDKTMQIGFELKPALLEADVLILAAPSRKLASYCEERVRPALKDAQRLRMALSLTKGMEEETNRLPTDILQAAFPDLIVGGLSGPSFASEVAAGQPTAVALAADSDDPFVAEAQAALSAESMRVYTTRDVVGVELGGCLKNAYAIAAGICDGLKLGDNPRAALVTRALAEMLRVGEALGGRRETFYGLSGVGDLMLTCFGQQSRNRTFGQLVAEGESIETLIEERKMTVEGFHTAESLHAICLEKGVDAPILGEIHAVLREGKSPSEAIRSLMTRDLKPEWTG